MKFDANSLDNRDSETMAKYLGFVDGFLRRYHRAEVRGVERVPKGAGLYVGNHNAGPLTPDSFLFCAEVYHAHGEDAVPYGLAHETAVTLPGVRDVFIPLGAVRGSPENARRLFEAGKKMLVYPGGDLDSMRPFRKRNKIVFGGRQGYARVAIRHGIPITPVVSAGAHSTWIVLTDGRRFAKWLGVDKLMRLKAWPIVLSMPWGLTLGPVPFYFPFPTKILIDLLDPIRFERSGEKAASDDAYVAECDSHVRNVMQVALTRLAAERQGIPERNGS